MNSSGFKSYILLPAYNEEKSLVKLIPALKEQLKSDYEIVVVDDGSKDKTKVRIKRFKEKYNISYIAHPENQGLGETIRIGLTHILKKAAKNDRIVIMDADYTHPPELIKKMAAELDKRKDIVIASRFCRGGRQVGVRFFRKFFSFSARIVMSVIFNVRNITDYTSGYRIYRAGLIKEYLLHRGELPVKAAGFESTVELLMKLIFFGAAVKEVPLILRYDRRETPTKMNLPVTILGYLIMVVKLKILRTSLTRKNNIMQIINIPWYSGLASYAEDMGIYSQKAGYDIDFAVVGESELIEKIQKNFRTLSLYGRSPVNTFKSILKIRRSLNNTKFIFAHTGSSFFLGVAASLFKKTKVYRVRAERGKIKKNIFNIILHKLAAGVIVPTIPIKKVFQKFGIKDRKIYYLPPVVDSDNFYPQPLKKSNIVGIVGRLDKIKGHGVLIESLTLVKREIEEIKLIIAGNEEGVTEKKLMDKARRLGVAGNIRFMGKVKYGTIPAIMAECRAGIIASLGSEAVSRVAVEWMACGRPVIASKVGCLEQFIINNYNGFLVSPGDPEELGIRIIELLKIRDLNQKMAQKAGKYAAQHFTPEIYVRNLKKILDE